jgi:hypothetical protein
MTHYTAQLRSEVHGTDQSSTSTITDLQYTLYTACMYTAMLLHACITFSSALCSTTAISEDSSSSFTTVEVCETELVISDVADNVAPLQLPVLAVAAVICPAVAAVSCSKV